MPEHVRTIERKSRGVVACMLCGRLVERGEVYRVTTYKYEGRLYDWPVCPHCAAFGEIVDLMDLTGADYDGYTGDDVRTSITDGRLGDVARPVAIAANRYLRQWRNERTGELYPVPRKETA